MFLTVHDPLGGIEDQAIDTMGLSLGALIPPEVEELTVNGRKLDNWREFIPRQGDRIEIWEKAEWFGGGLIFFAGTSAAFYVPGAVVSAVVSVALSAALSSIVTALTPKPKKPKFGDRKEAFGIAGFSNTTGPGTPKFTPYGLNLVRGHVIASGVRLSDDGTQMYGRVLYFMGWTGGDGIGSWGKITLNGTEVSQYPEIRVHTRDGTGAGQTVIPEFQNVDNVFQPSSGALDFDPNMQPGGTPLIYTTQSSAVQRVTLFIYFPTGLYRINQKGKYRDAGVTHDIEIRPNGGGAWTLWHQTNFSSNNPSGHFYAVQLADFPSPGKWDIRVTVTSWGGWVWNEPFAGSSILYNVQETEFTTLNYPEWALLALTDIPSKKVQSLSTMDVAAVMEGKRVKIPDGQGNTTLAFTRQRCWIVRDMMTHPIIGMGNQIEETEIDDDQWIDSQSYYDELVDGHGVAQEYRDYCDFILSAIDWDWDWVKKVAGEVRGRIIPSGGKWKYVIDKPGTPNIAYVEGGNIVENSINLEIGPAEEHQFNQISGEFRNADKDYAEDFSPMLIDAGIGSDPPVPEYAKYETITRESEIQRENMILLKRNILERRRWTFLSPVGAIVSEPLDIDYFGERGIGNEGAVGGLLPTGSTISQLILPNVMTLQAGETYAAIVKHKRDNVTEYRTVSTAAGVTGTIDVSSPFNVLPEEEDIFSIGIEDIDHIPTRCQEIQIDREGRVKQVRTEYVAAIYTQDPLPPKSERKFFGPTHNYPPLPLRYATISEEVAVNRDGSVRSILLFAVTPGLSAHAGIAQAGSTTTITMADAEPGVSDYFIGADISCNGETRACTAYDGASRVATFAIAFSAPIQSGDQYYVKWEQFGEFGGFRIEQSDDGVGWTSIGTANTTHWESDGRGAGPGTVYFRLTPRSTAGIENAVARYVIPIIIQGDLSAPAAPASVEISSYLLNVRVLVTLTKPVAEDFASVEVEVWRNEIAGATGVLLDVTRFGASADTGASGTMQVECPFNLGARNPPEQYGAVVWARARAKDYSDNPLEGTPEYDSLAVSSPSGTTLTPDPNATGVTPGPPAIPTGLAVTSGLALDPTDGQWKPYLNIAWDPNTEPDISKYEVHYRPRSIQNMLTPRIVYHPQVSIREIGVLGNTDYEAQVQAINRTDQRSGFTSWVLVQSGLTARDTTPPGPPTGVSVTPGFEMNIIRFTPPADSDYAASEIRRSTVNNVLTAVVIGRAPKPDISFRDINLSPNATYYYWLLALDSSGNYSPFHTGATNGATGGATRAIGPGDIVTSNLITNTAQIGTAVIEDANIHTITADKITGGSLQVAFNIGVGPAAIYIDGATGRNIVVYDENLIARAILGKFGNQATDYGLTIFGPDGTLWFAFSSGMQTPGIMQGAITVHSEFRDDSTTFFNSGTDNLIASRSFTSTGNTVIVVARCKIEKNASNPFTGSPFRVVLKRDGTEIDAVRELTSQGKHFNLNCHDDASAGTHTYSLHVESQASISADINAILISCLEQKR